MAAHLLLHARKVLAAFGGELDQSVDFHARPELRPIEPLDHDLEALEDGVAPVRAPPLPSPHITYLPYGSLHKLACSWGCWLPKLMRCLCSQWGLSQCHTHCHMHRLDLAATGRARVLWARGHVGTLGRQCKRAGRDRLAFVSPLRRHVSGVRHDAVRDQISGLLAQLARCAAPPSPSRSRARVLRHGGPARTLHRHTSAVFGSL